MAIDLSAVFSEKINRISHDHGGLVTSRGIASPIKSPPSKATTTLPNNSLFASLLSQNNLQIGKRCEQTKQLIEGAKALYDSIDIIKKSLIENRRDYIDMYGSLFPSKLSDDDRNQIDEEVQEGIVECQARLVVLKNQVKEKGPRLGSQRHAVISAIIESCELYLKNVCDTFTELRSFRMKRSFDKRKLARLDRGYDFDDDLDPGIFQPSSSSFSNDHSQRRSEQEETADRFLIGDSFDRDSEIDQLNDTDQFDTPSNELISLQEENEKIYQNFCSMVGETRQVEKSLVQIAKLNRTFQENFLLQNEDIQRVQTTAFQTSANIKDGNDELRGAIRNKARAIYWIIFVNLVLTFSLIFLDWYNV